MSKLPSLTPRKVIRAIEKAGFEFIRQKGSHRIYQKGERYLVVPYHNKDLKVPTLKSIIEQSGMTIEEFIKLL